MAEVWLATDMSLSRQVAVKILKSTLAADPIYAPEFLPCGTWNVSQALLARYGIDQDGLQNGSPGNGGPYYQFFWATRKGITGHDINK